MSFSDNIKTWVSIDNDIRKLNEDIKLKRAERNKVLENIIEYKIQHDIGSKIIKYNNETLKFSNTRQYQSITYDYIKSCLSDIIDDQEQIDFIIQYMKEKRQYKNVEDLKRFYK